MAAAVQMIEDDPEDACPVVDAEETGSRRRCVATGLVQAKDAMIRFAVAPDGRLVPDLEERLPGRGLWLTAEAGAFARALTKNLFAKAARRAVRVEEDLPARLMRLLERRCLDHIGLARRAGQLVAGYEKVREALKSGHVGRAGPPGLLIEAADGSPDQFAKLAALAPGLAVMDLFAAEELAAALGREHAVHAVMARGRLAETLARDALRLKGIKGTKGPVAGNPASGSETPTF